MQIGISILLSFAVFKLRLSDDVPVQSDSIPLINVYFTLCISFSLASMVWFSILDYMRERKKPLAKWLRVFVLKYLCSIMRIKLDDLRESKPFLFLLIWVQFEILLIYEMKSHKV